MPMVSVLINRGRVLVADYSNNRVQVFTADGIFCFINLLQW